MPDIPVSTTGSEAITAHATSSPSRNTWDKVGIPVIGGIGGFALVAFLIYICISSKKKKENKKGDAVSCVLLMIILYKKNCHCNNICNAYIVKNTAS